MVKIISKNCCVSLKKRSLNPFTIAAINASGNESMTKEQKIALDDFFGAIGAFGSKSNIFGKLDMVYLPMLASTLNKALINYKDNSESNTIPDAEHYSLVNGGIHVISSGQPLKVREGFLWDVSKRMGMFLTTTDSDINKSGYQVFASCHNSGGTDFHRICMTSSGSSAPYNYFKLDYKFNNNYSVAFGSSAKLGVEKGIRAIVGQGDKATLLAPLDNKELVFKEDYQTEISSTEGDLFLMSKEYSGAIVTGQCDEGAMVFGNDITLDEAQLLKGELVKLYNEFYPDNAIVVM